MPFKSRKQWKWGFANKKKFAREWAHKTPSYKKLPNRARRRKGGKRK